MILAAGTALACKGSTDPSSLAAPVAAAVFAGDDQIRFPGTQLNASFSVAVVDPSGTPVPLGGIPVTWRVIVGGGTLGSVSDTTRGDGVAHALLTLGPDLGINEVEARVDDFEPVVFRARAADVGPIAFVSNRRGATAGGARNLIVGDLHVMKADGSDVVMLFALNRSIELTHDPVWKPDGSGLLYVRGFDIPAGGTAGVLRLGIHLISANGVEDRRVPLSGVPDEALELIEPTWSPNGRTIVSRLDLDGQLYTMSASGNNLKRLADDDMEARSPAWSPTRDEIVFVCESGGSDTDLCIIDTDGTNLKLLTTDEHDDGEPAWSPDGEWVLFSRDTSSAGGVWLVNRDGTGSRRVVVGSATSPAWAPDGEQFAVSMSLAGQRDIYVVRLDDGSALNLTDSRFVDRQPHWRW